MSDPEINPEAVYNKQECVDSFMARDDLDSTQMALRQRIVAMNNSLSRKGHDLEHARRTLAAMEQEFQEIKSQTNGLIEFVLAIEIGRREKEAAEARDHGSNGVTKSPTEEVRHGA